ncbi:MAG: hypothetical protein SOZ73_02260, partial [Campylobacter sp.]|nr:hypothetical protein [Campylobacter sp.]
MKKMFFALIASFALSSAVFGAKYKELPDNIQFQNAGGSVIEIISYGCIYCYHHHKAHTLANAKKLGASVEVWQVEQMAPFGADFAKILAFARAIDTKNEDDITDEGSATNSIMDAYFEATFVLKVSFKSADEFYAPALAIFEKAGHAVSINDIKNYRESDAGKAYLERSAQGLEVAKIV